ncbi:zygote arrest protein 1 [Erpetoichthys calabaricus]|uniref:Zygote arrest 1 n=1 Tax=Erpetoichthys calabaricus TaxID=27687 RepID=A0A8C4SFC0_ERPCA|nr:zygote arrest protein 1 [Erpetoichthys calabaricus]
MASYGEEARDSYLYSSYNPYSYRYLNPKPKGSSWRPKSYFTSYGEVGDYFDNQQRAQLKSILSQINPNLIPRLRKANTKDVGVQVNPKTDASVQCSLGPRTLLARRRRRPDSPVLEPGSPTSEATVRFPRTLAVYSPIASRRLASFLEETEENPDDADQNIRPDQGTSREEKDEVSGNVVTADASDKDDLKEEDDSGGGIVEAKDGKAVGEVKQQAAEGSKARVRFQFLEQKYGYYHCRDCNLRWESAYVWCVQGTNKVYFKQFCRTCQKAFNPYRVEDITCPTCKHARCTCTITMRHVDPKRPHRQDLCGRCKGKRLSCDSTFSFKYII